MILLTWKRRKKTNDFDKIKLNLMEHVYIPMLAAFKVCFIGLYSYSGQTKDSWILFSVIGAGIELSVRKAHNTVENTEARHIPIIQYRLVIVLKYMHSDSPECSLTRSEVLEPERVCVTERKKHKSGIRNL